MEVGRVELPAQAALTPATPLVVSVQVANTTDAGAPFTIEAVMGAATVDGHTGQLLADHLTVESAVAPASGQCAGADFGETSSTAIAKGASATFCIRVSLASDTPARVQGSAALLTLPVTATQLPMNAR